MAAKKKAKAAKRPREKVWDATVRPPVAILKKAFKDTGDGRLVVLLTDGTRVTDGLAFLHIQHHNDPDKLLGRWDVRGFKLSAREDRLMALSLVRHFKNSGVKITASDWHRFRSDLGWVAHRRDSASVAKREAALAKRGYDRYSQRVEPEPKRHTEVRGRSAVPVPPSNALKRVDGYSYSSVLPDMVVAAFHHGNVLHSPVSVFLDRAGRPEWVVGTVFDENGKEEHVVAARVVRFK